MNGRPQRRVCIVDFASARLVPIETGARADRAPQFSPDGSRLAFLSLGANGMFGLRIVTRAGSFNDPEPAPDVPGTIETFAWSPDGTRILAVAAAPGTDNAGSESSGTVPLPPRGASWEPWVIGGHDAGYGRSLWIIDLAGASVHMIAQLGFPWDAGWAGTNAVLAIASDGPAENDWYGATLRLAPLDGGAARVIRTPRRQAALPAGSPDGAHAAWIEAACSDRRVVAGDLVVGDVNTGRCATAPTLGIDVTSFAWISARRVFFIGQRGLETAAGIYDLETATSSAAWSTPESCGGRYPHAAPRPDGSFAVIVESYTRYPTVALIEGGAIAKDVSLHHPGATALRANAGTIAPYRWNARDGLSMEGLLVTPPGEGPFPLMLNVHGGPIFAWRNRWQMASPLVPLLVRLGYAVLHPNPRGSSGRGQAFAERIIGDLCGEETWDHLTGIDALVADGIVDPARLAVMGASHGGQMTCWIVSQTERFRAAIAMSPFTDFFSARYGSNMGRFFPLFLGSEPDGARRWLERSPVFAAPRVRTPVLLTAGDLDRCTPPAQAIEFQRALTEHGVPSELVIYPEDGHGSDDMRSSLDLVLRVTTWLDRHVPGSSRTEREA
jgi:dipeptidyl aminopeptidase/acylaminoacyl peptidase